MSKIVKSILPIQDTGRRAPHLFPVQVSIVDEGYILVSASENFETLKDAEAFAELQTEQFKALLEKPEYQSAEAYQAANVQAGGAK
jgi:hypothetical protein